MATKKKNEQNKGVLVIYTGGTIGSMPRDPNDPESPQIVVEWETFMKQEKAKDFTQKNLGFRLDCYPTKPLDSCNIGPEEWKEMAIAIEKNYNNYEGFVILHGTDTMVYTASALSFMLVNLEKPVIITGAQLAFLFNPRNDGFQNMLTSILIANPDHSKIPVIPEVCIFFNGKLLRGNRARKMHASGFDAYHTPNYSNIGIAGESILIDERLIRKIPTGKKFAINKRLEQNVVAVNFFPGIQDGNILQNILNNKDLKGVVLMAYGAGNIPTNKPEILQLLKKATSRGVIAYVVTQCGGGSVQLGIYETSALLLEAGAVSGVDITPEAALTKLMVLLGDEDMSYEQKALRAQQNLSGEQSLSIYTTEYKKNTDEVSKKFPRKRIPSENINGLEFIEDENKVNKIVLRFRGGKIANSENEKPVNISIYLDLGSDDELNENSPNYMGTYTKAVNSTPAILLFDITENSRKILGNRASFTVHMKTETGLFEWTSIELVLYVSEL